MHYMSILYAFIKYSVKRITKCTDRK